MRKGTVLQGRGANGLSVEGYALVCPDSILGWNGLDARTGEILMYDGEELGGDDFVPGFLCKFCKNFTNPDQYGIGARLIQIPNILC